MEKKKEDWKEYQKEYRLKNKEKSKEYSKEYYVKNKEYIKEYGLKNRERLSKYHKEYYSKNREILQKHIKEYNLKNREKIDEYQKEYRLKNKEKLEEYRKGYRLKNREKLIEQSRQYYAENREEYLKQNKEYYAKNKEKRNAYCRHKKQTNPNFRLRCNLASRLRDALKHGSKSASTMELVGCTIAELWIHLESKFEPWMTRENYGIGGWDLDHIRACATFDLTDPAQQRECFHWSNLQPLEHIANIKKGAR